jgi:transcriptional regulator with XRE-family HTH domain
LYIKYTIDYLLCQGAELMSTFGRWVRQIRTERKLGVRELAKQCGVDVGTISRIENERSHVTVYTAVRICEALKIALPDLVQALKGTRNWAIPAPGQMPPGVLTLTDVENVVEFYARQPHTVHSLLASLLNTLSTNMSHVEGAKGETEFRFFPENMASFLNSSILFDFELRYPPEIDAAKLYETYQRGGVLTPTDVQTYIEGVRRERQKASSGLGPKIKISDRVLNRLESGLIELVKLNDLLELDERHTIEGRILGMYWKAGEFGAKRVRSETVRETSPESNVGWTDQQFRVACLLVTIYRWRQYLGWEEVAWVEDLRSEMKHIDA